MKEESSQFLNLELEAANEKTSSDRLTELASVTTDLARIIAKNPSATPELLRKLSASCDFTTRLHVTLNPNTPTDILLELGRSFPEQLLRNPRYPLLLQENPNLLAGTLQNLLKLEGLPVYVLEKFAKHQNVWVRAEIAINANTPVTILEELARDRDTVRQSVAHNLNAPKSILQELAKDINWRVRQAVASNPNTAENTLEELSWDNQWHIRVAVASNPSTPTRILDNFRWDNDRGMRQALAQNPNTPTAILKQLAFDKDFEIRQDVGRNPNIPMSVLETLVRDREFAVCFLYRNMSLKY